METKQPDISVVQEGVPTKTIEVPAGSKVVVEKVITKDTPPDEPNIGGIQLMSNWRQLIKKYSFIFTVLTIVTGLAGFVLPFLSFLQPALDESTFGIVMFIFSMLAGASTFIKQRKLNTHVVEVKEED